MFIKIFRFTLKPLKCYFNGKLAIIAKWALFNFLDGSGFSVLLVCQRDYVIENCCFDLQVNHRNLSQRFITGPGRCQFGYADH